MKILATLHSGDSLYKVRKWQVHFLQDSCHLHNPGILLATAHISDPTSTHVPVAPQPSISHAQVPPPLLLPSLPLERMFDSSSPSNLSSLASP